MTPITIEYPQFPEEIKVSESRMPKYFLRNSGEEIPLKYKGKQFIWKPKAMGGVNKMVLYNTEEKSFVVKNPIAAGKPRFVPIAGNDIMRMHEQVRNRIVVELKRFFLAGMEDVKPIILKYPLVIRMELRTFPHYMNWDLDNLWIYNKCFQDALKEKGIIPDDNIRYITGAAAPRFVPITKEEDRAMEFTIYEETSPLVKEHIMYHYRRSVFIGPLLDDKLIPQSMNRLNIALSLRHGKAGDVIVEGHSMHGYICWVNIGTKGQKVETALERVRHQCYQLNAVPVMSQEDYTTVADMVNEVFFANGVPVRID